MKICSICRARFRDNDPANRCPLDSGELVLMPDPLLGRTLAGRYVISEKIGSGGMGTVYRARHDVVGRDVAVKFLAPELALDPTNRSRFLREAKAANRINHEHIIDITDFGETEDGLVYLVMEYLDGTPLSAETARGPVGPVRAIGIALQLAHALARAHELDVIHRDIKPANIFLLRGYEEDFVKLLDFGLAQMKGERRITATGAVFGTPEYIPPEQARGAPLTASADLYALGCVLFELLTGRPPFEGRTHDLIMKHMRRPAPAPSSIQPAVPPDLDAVVLKLLEKNPDSRHSDAYHLIDDLKRVLARVPGASEPRRATLLRGGAGTATTAPDPPLNVEDAWRERVALLRDLVPRLHASSPPSWLTDALVRLEKHVGAISSLRSNLDEQASLASKHEEDMRDARLRIGRALDELAQDESRVARDIAATETDRNEAEDRTRELERPLLRAWGAIAPMPASGARITREIVDSLEEAGAIAAAWLSAEQHVATLTRNLESKQREQEDLAFQIAQLKGRLGTLNAESDISLGRLRDETKRLDASIQREIDVMVREAEPVVRHFLAASETRDLVLRGTADLGSRVSAREGSVPTSERVSDAERAR